MAQQLRLALGPRPDIAEAALDAAADRQHVTVADEDGDLTNPQIPPVDLEHVQDREERVAVLFDLGTLMAVLRVFHRQRMQVELTLQVLEFACLRVGDGDPDETVGMADELTDFRDGDVGDLVTVTVGDAVDEHAIS